MREHVLRKAVQTWAVAGNEMAGKLDAMKITSTTMDSKCVSDMGCAQAFEIMHYENNESDEGVPP